VTVTIKYGGFMRIEVRCENCGGEMAGATELEGGVRAVLRCFRCKRAVTIVVPVQAEHHAAA
jgi:hypothetical protein